MVTVQKNTAAAAPMRVAVGSGGVQLVVFSGTRSESVVTWRSAAAHALSAAGLAADEKKAQAADALYLALAGAARARIEALDATDRDTPTKVFDVLAAAFPSATAVRALDALLDLRLDLAVMSVNEYTAYFAKAIADVSGKFDDGDQVSFFLRGMDPAFRAQVLSRGSPTKLGFRIDGTCHRCIRCLRRPDGRSAIHRQRSMVMTYALANQMLPLVGHLLVPHRWPRWKQTTWTRTISLSSSWTLRTMATTMATTMTTMTLTSLLTSSQSGLFSQLINEMFQNIPFSPRHRWRLDST